MSKPDKTTEQILDELLENYDIHVVKMDAPAACHCEAEPHHVVLRKDGTYQHVMLPRKMTVLEALDYIMTEALGMQFIATGNGPPPVDLNDAAATHKWLAALQMTASDLTGKPN